MLNRTNRNTAFRAVALAAVVATAALGLAGCSGNTPAEDDDTIGVALITKTNTNPFFIAMKEGAEAASADSGVSFTFGAGKEDGDEDTQIKLIEDAIARGDAGILITPNGPGVNDAILKARDAGLYVIALDTPPDPADTVDITFATDNRLAGQLIGEWTAAQLDGAKATIALLDLFDDKIVSVDYNRDQGFLEGMGIDVADGNVNGDEAATGTYSGGDYEIVGNAASNGAEDGGLAAMETLLSKNPNINVVYTINEPAAYGAYQALQAAGKAEGVLIVSVDGGCAGVDGVKDGVIGATSQQYPVKMAELEERHQAVRERWPRLLQHRSRARHRHSRRRCREHRHGRSRFHLLGLSTTE